jgi:hypothetical protein
VIVRFIELGVIISDLTVVVDHVAEMIEKRGSRTVRSVQVAFHRGRDRRLVFGTLNSAGVSDCVKA